MINLEWLIGEQWAAPKQNDLLFFSDRAFNLEWIQSLYGKKYRSVQQEKRIEAGSFWKLHTKNVRREITAVIV